MHLLLTKQDEETGSQELLGKILGIISDLENEHENAGKILKELRSITDNYRLPEDACPTYGKTYQVMQDLESDLFNHIHLENNILHQRLLPR